MKTFNDNVAVITGAASGIGRELALELAQRNCHLAICCDRNVEGLEQTAQEARIRGVKVTTQSVDVADRQAVHDWAEEVAAQHGRVNLLFNNAAVEIASTVETTEATTDDAPFTPHTHGTSAPARPCTRRMPSGRASPSRSRGVR